MFCFLYNPNLSTNFYFFFSILNYVDKSRTHTRARARMCMFILQTRAGTVMLNIVPTCVRLWGHLRFNTVSPALSGHGDPKNVRPIIYDITYNKNTGRTAILLSYAVHTVVCERRYRPD